MGGQTVNRPTTSHSRQSVSREGMEGKGGSLIKYRCDRASIEALEVDSETSKTVRFHTYFERGGIITSLDSTEWKSGRWFDTWAEAKAHLLKLHDQRVAGFRDSLALAEADLERARQIEEPE